jgi:hypothetical protein
MTYLDELLAGYRQGLDDDPPSAIQAVHSALAETNEPRQRGALLGLLANALVIRAAHQSSSSETPNSRLTVTYSAQNAQQNPDPRANKLAFERIRSPTVLVELPPDLAYGLDWNSPQAETPSAGYGVGEVLNFGERPVPLIKLRPR